jgi:aminobenzoyl-glutamate utilization protein B
MRFPSNVPGLPGHHWANAIAMATPIAHKGVTAGARVQAMTIIDLLTKPELVSSAKDYFENVQQAKKQYKPMITKDDKPAIHLNAEIMKEFRPQLEKFYYDETKYDSYLEQLGIKYPTVKN